jgi:GTP-binding protein
VDGTVHEPYEEVIIHTQKEYLGKITEEFGRRKAELIDMVTDDLKNDVKLKYKISDNNLLGVRSILTTQTRGTTTLNTFFLGYFPRGSKMDSIRNGALVAVKPGTSLSYGIANAQERGDLFVGSGVEIYEGMVVGVASRNLDIEVNICKAKKLTNNRSVGEGVKIQLTPPTILTLEQSLDFINDDELLEVTPLSLRIRKKVLNTTQRRVVNRSN